MFIDGLLSLKDLLGRHDTEDGDNLIYRLWRKTINNLCAVTWITNNQLVISLKFWDYGEESIEQSSII